MDPVSFRIDSDLLLIESRDSQTPQTMLLQFLCSDRYRRIFRADANDPEQSRFRIQFVAVALMNYPDGHHGLRCHFRMQPELAARITDVARLRAFGEKT